MIDSKLRVFIEKSDRILATMQSATLVDAFSISGYPHFENVISNWLAFYFDTSNEHGFGNLFGEALHNAILKKDHSASLDWLLYDTLCTREVLTEKGNFIDLVVYSQGDEDEQDYENALIMEHKVNAGLYNDLEDYYDSIHTERDKYAIILSAKERDDKALKFLNISYAEFLHEILPLLGKYQQTAKHRYILYLNDLLNNMDTLSSNTPTEDIDFCFQYGQELKDLVDLKYAAERKILDQIKIVLSESVFEYHKRYQNSFSITAEDKGISINFSLDTLFSQKQSTFQFWLKDDLVKAWNAVDDITTIEDYCTEKGFAASKKKIGKNWVEVAKGTLVLQDNTPLGIGEQWNLFLQENICPMIRIIKELLP